MDPALLTLLLALALLAPLLLTWTGRGLARVLPPLAVEAELQQELLRHGEASMWRTWRQPLHALELHERLPDGPDRKRLEDLLHRYARVFPWKQALWLGYLLIVVLQLEAHQLRWWLAFIVCFVVMSGLQLPVYFEVRRHLRQTRVT